MNYGKTRHLLAAIGWLVALPCYAQTYTISTIAGNGSIGSLGDGGPGQGASLSNPSGVAVDSAGNIYIADSNNYKIRRVSPDGTITTFAGTGQPGFLGDGGPATAAEFIIPSGLSADAAGNVYVADTNSSRIRKISPNGTITTVAGSGSCCNLGDGGPAISAEINQPLDVTVDAAGNLFIADTQFSRVRKVTPAGVITTVAGNGKFDYSGDGGPATSAALNGPRGVAEDAAGNLYITDACRIRKVAPNGIITTVAGGSSCGYSGDGALAVNAKFSTLQGIAMDSAGNLYIADFGNSAIRKIANGIVTTIGGGGKDRNGDGGPAINASLSGPSDIALDAAGNVYFADGSEDRVRVLRPVGGTSGLQAPSIKAGGVVTASAFGGSSAIAPGSWIEIYGSNLATNARSWANADFHGLNAPSVLDGTSVSIGGQAAFLSYISPTQLDAQVPSDVGTGTQPMVVTTAGGSSAPYMVTVNATQPGLLAPPSFQAGGKQYVVAISADGSSYILPPGAVPGVPARRAKPGETIILVGVGFGPVSPSIPAGVIVRETNTLSSNFEILFGSTVARTSFAGLAPFSIGLYQFNVTVPTVPSSDSVPLSFELNGVTGKQNLSIAVQD
jgi:uncharacterized protein (TIGR03437 family)